MITNDGKTFRFEDSDRFGPTRLRENNEINERHPYFGHRSAFWPAYDAWKKGGRRVADDRITCIWDTLKPTKIYRVGRRTAVIVEHGDEGGPTVDVTDEMKAKGVQPTDFLDKSARNKPGSRGAKPID